MSVVYLPNVSFICKLFVGKPNIFVERKVVYFIMPRNCNIFYIKLLPKYIIWRIKLIYRCFIVLLHTLVVLCSKKKSVF